MLQSVHQSGCINDRADVDEFRAKRFEGQSTSLQPIADCGVPAFIQHLCFHAASIFALILTRWAQEALPCLSSPFRKLESLFLAHCELRQFPERRSFPSLTWLRLEAVKGLASLPAWCLELAHLHLERCDDLQELLSMPEQQLSRLETLVIASCLGIHRLPDLSSAKKLQTLVGLHATTGRDGQGGLWEWPLDLGSCALLRHLHITIQHPMPGLGEKLLSVWPSIPDTLKSLRLRVPFEHSEWEALTGIPLPADYELGPMAAWVIGLVGALAIAAGVSGDENRPCNQSRWLALARVVLARSADDVASLDDGLPGWPQRGHSIAEDLARCLAAFQQGVEQHGLEVALSSITRQSMQPAVDDRDLWQHGAWTLSQLLWAIHTALQPSEASSMVPLLHRQKSGGLPFGLLVNGLLVPALPTSLYAGSVIIRW